MTTVLYVANIRFPTEKAHGKQVREMCNALAGRAEVTLVVANRATQGTPQSFGVSPKVRVVYIPVLDTVGLGRLGFLFESLQFALGAALYALFNARGSVVLTREYGCAAALAFAGMRVAWESHRGEYNIAVRAALAFGARLVVISEGLADLYRRKGVPPERILLARDGFDGSRYLNLPGKEEARKKLGLPLDKTIAIYNGHLHTWKGSGTLAQAALLLPHAFLVIFMGGTDEDIAQFRQKYNDPRISVIGRKGDTERPLYLRAADAAMLPNTGTDEISALYTSPLKLFGYMAAGTAVVSSDLPSVREVLSEETAYFAMPDDPQSFADRLLEVAADPLEADRKGRRAKEDVQQYEWGHRARLILDFLS